MFCWIEVWRARQSAAILRSRDFVMPRESDGGSSFGVRAASEPV